MHLGDKEAYSVTKSNFKTLKKLLKSTKEAIHKFKLQIEAHFNADTNL